MKDRHRFDPADREVRLQRASRRHEAALVEFGADDNHALLEDPTGLHHATPPERPSRSSAVPSPLLDFQIVRPPALSLAVAIWIGSGLAGFAIVAYFTIRMEAVRLIVDATIAADDPNLTSSQRQSAVFATMAVGFVAMAVVVWATLTLAVLMAGRRHWARVLLAIIGILAAPVTTIGSSLLTGGSLSERTWLQLVHVTQAVLALIGFATMFLPAPNRWFRARLRT